MTLRIRSSRCATCRGDYLRRRIGSHGSRFTLLIGSKIGRLPIPIVIIGTCFAFLRR